MGKRKVMVLESLEARTVKFDQAHTSKRLQPHALFWGLWDQKPAEMSLRCLHSAEVMEITVTRKQEDAVGRIQSDNSVHGGRLPIYRRRLRMVFHDVMLGKRKWRIQDLAGCDGLSLGEAKILLTAMYRCGLLVWRDGRRNHSNGAKLTEAVQAIADKLSYVLGRVGVIRVWGLEDGEVRRWDGLAKG